MNGQLAEQTSGMNWGVAPGLMAHEYSQQVAVWERGISVSALPELEEQMRTFARTREEELAKLRKLYVFWDADQVEEFLRTHRALTEIFLEAVIPLRECFGIDAPLALDVTWEEGPPKVIYGLVVWRGERTAARAALRRFDESWWIDNSRRSAGKIVFDYELA